jgi:cell division protein ZapD
VNERIRTLMRLEDLFQRAQFFVAQPMRLRITRRSPVLFEITDVAARADLKTDILQELERQKQLLTPLRSNPAIETRVLEPLLSEIDRASAALLAQTGKAGVHLRDNEWLMTIKQRTAIPGGVCEFDLPGYHYWLHGEPAARQNDLNGWIEPFKPIFDGLAIILRLLRDNGRATRQTAYRGVFQLMLTTRRSRSCCGSPCRSICLACRRSARTSTRSTSGSSASLEWIAARSTTTTWISSSRSAISDVDFGGPAASASSRGFPL